MASRFLLLVCCYLLTGCTTSRSIFEVSAHDESAHVESELDVSTNTSHNSDSETDNPHVRGWGEAIESEPSQVTYMRLESALREELKDWHGTPHVLGGNSKTGVDCSGLIQQVYADLLNIQTGRTTEQLIKEGTRVRKSRLKVGDLVFFSPDSKRGSHVGIYLSKGEFTHASSSRGVMTSKISNPYWNQSYETGRRIIPDETWLLGVIDRIEQRQELARALQTSAN